MYLKSLELQGFKSFPNKTRITFDSDITAIVGPNGSGKSNISDAISWVLGEMRTKTLRGTKMEDVIFSGTADRSPLGFAEATLILDNRDGAFQVDSSEVMVTRRYYRSGESEYYINRQSALLRDINELFMDTGLGREGYYNIGQGRIDEILSQKSTERREVFEEAAGISKYRHRKEETERRLSDTADNLLRVGDKISELELSIEPLRKQAEVAKKYLAYRNEIKGLEITLWLESLQNISAAAKKAEGDYSSAVFILGQQQAELERLYGETERLTQALNAGNQSIEVQREAIGQLESDTVAKEGEIALLRGSVDHHRQDIVRIRKELESQQQRSGGLQEQVAAQKQRVAEIKKSREALDETLRELATRNLELSSSGDDYERKILALRAQQALLFAGNADKKAEIASITASVSETAERRARILEDQAQARQKLEQVAGKTADSEKRLREARDAATASKNTIAGYELRMKTRTEKRDILQKSADALSIELKTVESRMRIFQEMQREYEGFSKAVKLVMRESERGVLRHIHGPISSLIRTRDEYTIAIETALGAAMQHIVVDTDEDGKLAISMLKRRDAGRATFLPLHNIDAKSINEPGLDTLKGFVGIALELVTFDPKYHSVIANRLGRVVVSDNLDSAIAIARRFHNRFQIVTLDGQVMNPGGSMTGGSVTKNAGILSRANELARLDTKLASLREKRSRIDQELVEAARAAAEVEFQLATERGELRRAEDDILYLEGESKQFQLLQDAIAGNLEGCERDLAELQTRSEACEDRLAALQTAVSCDDEKSLALESEISACCQTQSSFVEQNVKISERITAIKMEVAASEAERIGAEESIRQLETLANEIRSDHAQQEALITEIETDIAEMLEQISMEESTLQALQQSAADARTALINTVDTRAGFEAKRTKIEKDAQELNKEILRMEREAARLEQKKLSYEMEEKQILDRLWDSYGLTHSTAAAETVELISTAAAQKRVTELKSKISALGTPNLGAVDEYARVNERYEYLVAQRDDVLQSKKDLETIITSITSEMTEIFLREFERINQRFSETFTELFAGGKASISLEDETAPLTCGIDIRVQPPGKQLKTLTLLSGGEKTLVAIALYFAILLVRPTPFCMLDEIDAALDDHNVERFAAYLRTFKKTQFIIITHRRGTMEASDVLCGVTMQEQGVSKLLHINLNEIENQVGITH